MKEVFGGNVLSSRESLTGNVFDFSLMGDMMVGGNGSVGSAN